MSFNLTKELSIRDKKVDKANQTFINKVMSVFNYNQDRIDSIHRTLATLEEEEVNLEEECVTLTEAMSEINNKGDK